jgi:hypothetical protein
MLNLPNIKDLLDRVCTIHFSNEIFLIKYHVRGHGTNYTFTHFTEKLNLYILLIKLSHELKIFRVLYQDIGL